MSDTKNVPVIEESEQKQEAYLPSEKERTVVNAVFNKFRISADNRNRNFENFDGLNLIDYIDDSVHRFTTNVDYRDNIEDWQARVHDQITRNKVLSVLGKVVQVLPIAEFRGRGDEDIRRGQLLSNLYEYSEDLDDYEELMVNILLEAIIKGTAIGFEGHEKKIQSIREIRGSGDDIKIKKGSKKINRLYGDIIRLEDFYPSSVGVRRIKDMPYCFVRTTMPYQQFLQDYAMYGKSIEVSPYSSVDATRESRPFYLDYVSNDVGEGNVEIIKYYNKDVDEYVIIANGIWLNPIKIKTTFVVSPIPYKHKELPFWEIRYESFDSSFFYGKSLPDKLKSMQDVLNVLTNMVLDQSFLTVFKPILTNGFDGLEDDYLRPGRRTPIDTQGLSIKDAVQELDMSTPTGWHQWILQYTRGIMEESSVDQLQGGSTAGLADRTPAQAVRVASEGVASVLGLFGRFVKYGIKRKALLRAKNIMQFWTDPKTPIIQQTLGDEGAKEFNKAFNTFKIENGITTSGKRGMKIIEMYANKADRPEQGELKARAAMFKSQTGQNIEIMAIPGSYLRDFEFDFKLIQNPKSEATKESEQAMQLEKTRVYLSFFPEIVDKTELFAETAEKMGDDPTKIMLADALPGAQPDEGVAKSMMDQGMSTQPQGDIANNMMRGMRGGEGGANEMQALAREVSG